MADYKVPPFLKRDGDALVFTDEGELIFYVPETYFDRGDAFIDGEYASLFGIFDYAIFDKNGKNSGLKNFFFPTIFLARPYAIDKQKGVKLTESQDAQDYRLVRFKKDDQVVVSVKVPQGLGSVETFYKLFLYGKLPTTIPINKLHKYFLKNIDLNGASYGISNQLIGVTIGEVARSKNDLSKAFRHTKSKDPTDYRMTSLMDLPKYISPNQSLSSQNWENALVGAIVNDDSDVDSPLEKLIMG